jgi:hypothetical protein
MIYYQWDQVHDPDSSTTMMDAAIEAAHRLNVLPNLGSGPTRVQI